MASASNTAFFASDESPENEPAWAAPSWLKRNAATNSTATLPTSTKKTTKMVTFVLPEDEARERKRQQNRAYRQRAKARKGMAQTQQLDGASQGSTSKIKTAPTVNAKRTLLSLEEKRMRHREHSKRYRLRQKEKKQEQARLSAQSQAKETNALSSDEDAFQSQMPIINFGASTSAVATAPSVSPGAQSDANALSLEDSPSVANSRFKRVSKVYQAKPISSNVYGTRSMIRLAQAREAALETRKPSNSEVEFLYEKPYETVQFQMTKISVRSISDMVDEQSHENSAMALLNDKPINHILPWPVPMESINSKQPRQLKGKSPYRSTLIQRMFPFPSNSQHARTLTDIIEEEEPTEEQDIEWPTKWSTQTMGYPCKRMKSDNKTTDDKPEQQQASPPLVNAPADEESQPMPPEKIEAVQDVSRENVVFNEADSEAKSTSASNPKDN